MNGRYVSTSLISHLSCLYRDPNPITGFLVDSRQAFGVHLQLGLVRRLQGPALAWAVLFPQLAVKWDFSVWRKTTTRGDRQELFNHSSRSHW